MPAYVMAQIRVTDPEGYKPYVEGFFESFRRHGGEMLVTSKQALTVLEGDWPHPKAVLLRFPDTAAARAWYDDPDYRALAEIRHRTAETNLVLVEGLDQPL